MGRTGTPARSAAADTQSAELASEIVDLVFALVGRMKRHFEETVAGLDLSPPQAHALRELSTDRDLSQRELAASLRCDASNVTGIVDRLEARGLVERRVSPADRRVNTLVVTSAGASLRDRLHRQLLAEAPPTTLLDEEEQVLLRDLLRKIVGPDGGPGCQVLP